MDFRNFLKQFDYVIDENRILKISNSYFLIDEKIRQTISRSREKPKSAGLFLGEEKNKEFKPSLSLLSLISKKSDRKIFIDAKSEWLFLCKRDIMGQSVIRSNVQKGITLVQDEKDNNLGIAIIISNKPENDRIYANNILDLGDYLRREKR